MEMGEKLPGPSDRGWGQGAARADTPRAFCSSEQDLPLKEYFTKPKLTWKKENKDHTAAYSGLPCG